ncbi:hypothetical protein Y032_0042g692 [Ancylostoma ceylanicum]|uniref:Uncharacterized protein n=1 Tax=Ancylostoma ceylanicum TaxID=53326 RepID=A0A016UGQ3_9BILA|nr:hypothetical protein Y032_0042g692 [Ancylostoma ceylanicum]
MSEGPQQKEISTMWLKSERRRDKKFRKDCSRIGLCRERFGWTAAAIRKDRRSPVGSSGFLLRSFRKFV